MVQELRSVNLFHKKSGAMRRFFYEIDFYGFFTGASLGAGAGFVSGAF